MAHILLLTSSPRGAESLSTRYATELAHGLRKNAGATLTVRDLVEQPAPHITPAYVFGRVKPQAARTAEEAAAVEAARELVNELMAADVVVLASGMINFGLSSQLKAWFDNITWPGVTFSYEQGIPRGLATGKKAYLVTAAGGVFVEGPYAPFDFQTTYLQHMLGFIGITDLELLRIEGTVLGPEAVATAANKADASVRALIAQAA